MAGHTETTSPLSDRDVLIAVMEAIGHLAEKLTGERLITYAVSQTGVRFAVRSSPGSWQQTEASSNPAPQG